MKKLFALFLSLTLLLGAVPALAQEGELTADDVLVFSDAPPLKIDLPDEARSNFPTPVDQVTVQDGIITLVSKGLTLTITPPFGIAALTQNIAAQVEDYLKMNDPRSIAEFLINGDLSILYYDFASHSQILMYTRENALSQMFQNSDETFDTLLATAQKSAREDTVFSEVTLNDKRYVRQQTAMEGGVRLVVYAIKDGVLVGFQLDMLAVTPELEGLMYQVVESAVF